MDLSTQHTPENITSIHDNIMLSVSGAPKTTRKRCLQGMQSNLAKNACNLNQLFSVQDTEGDVVVDAQTIAGRGCKTGIGKSLLTEQLFLSPLSPRYVMPTGSDKSEFWDYMPYFFRYIIRWASWSSKTIPNESRF